MNKKSLTTLEYDKIITMLVEFAASPGGKEFCRRLKPINDIHKITRAQKETTDAMIRIYKKGSISFGGLKELGGSLKRLEIGGILNAVELLAVASCLETANRAKSYGRRENEDENKDSLDELFERLEPLTFLAKEIRRCIPSEDEISDDASAGLKQVRRSMKITNEKIHSQMVSMVNNTSIQTYLQENVVTQRNGRYCLAVKAEYRNKIPGMIHDQSSSGSTLFVEPMAVLKFNNELNELARKEKEEIEKVLADLSNQTAEYTAAIAEDFKTLTLLDFIFAKGAFSKSYQGTEPEFNTRGRILIKQGRHPLLDKKKVVPIDIRLGDTFHQLIVTGPNTGGKTVSLKTVGLFTLMGQAGLNIPAASGSQLSVFHQVFADIGDEQSIEQSLSTFSAHMTNIVSILKEAKPQSLILFDELCSGTDPTEGAALAIAILSFLRKKKIRTMATTHYSELKVYALSTPEVENACCEFDVESLSPTYHLLIGIPGKSNAFAISKKLGLSEEIIEEARGTIDSEDQSFEELLADLEHNRLTMEREKEEISAYKNEIEALKKKLSQKEEKLSSQKEKILKEAQEKAYAILREAKDTADQTIKAYRKYGSMANAEKAMEQERNRLREKMSKTERAITESSVQVKKGKLRPEEIKIGDQVRVLSMNLVGTVTSLPNQKGMFQVQMGFMSSSVNIKDVEYLGTPKQEKPKSTNTGGGMIRMSKSASVSSEINLIGMTKDSAIMELDKYLDDAYLAHLSEVRIVHGKGTGVLRSAVHAHLKRQKYIDSFRLGVYGEGENGVTIARFKE